MTRPIQNLLGLAVLATVQERPMHRYEIATVIRDRGKDRDMAVKWGSLYTIVQTLTRHGFLEVVGSGREGNRPEKTIYEITDAGRAELRDWARELVAVPLEEQTAFVAGLSVLAVLSPAEAADLLQRRVADLHRLIERRRAELSVHGAAVPRLFLIEDEYQLAMLRAEADWIERLLAELRDGTFPAIADWQAFHEHEPVITGGAAADS
jgi:DNA-binding PadR family transcriptional regulator